MTEAVYARRSGIVCLAALVAAGSSALAADWPCWRHDANRSASSPADLPADLHLHWVRDYPALEPAWEDPVNRDRMPYDRAYEPVVMGSTLFVGSNRSDRITALDTRSGAERWRFYADGPVRFPPIAWRDKLFFVSDDGHLYCLKAETGDLAWKVRGGPDDRKILGNSRMISAWPARGGPALLDGVITFAASIWPFMGVFIHAVDAETGQTVWTNDELGSIYMRQPHGGSVSFAGLAPQGALAAIGDRLIVPNGRSVPACLDRKTGKLIYFHLSGSPGHKGGDSPHRKLEGGSHVSAIGEVYFNHRGHNTAMYDLATGGTYIMWESTTYPVLTEDVCYFAGSPVVARGSAGLKRVAYQARERDRRTRRTRTVTRHRWEMPELWTCKVDGSGALIKAGGRLYAGGKGVVSAIDPSAEGGPAVIWSAPVDGVVARIIAADDRLFVVTLGGKIYAFGPGEVQPRTYSIGAASASVPDGASSAAREILSRATVDRGVCLVFGLGSGELAEAIARGSAFHVVGVDADAAKVAALRRRFDDAGLYGTRISVHVGDATTFGAQPYVAALTVCEDPKAVGLAKGVEFINAIFRSMRPYGGVAYLRIDDASRRTALVEQIEKAGLPGASVTQSGPYVVLTRTGSLPGSADWTHHYADAANTTKSDDRRVRAPLGVLWFGGNTHMDVLPRHGHGPSEQVIGGRLFIQGIKEFSARDVYTGKMLWKRTFPDLGTFGAYYDKTYKPDPLDTSYNQVHIPGANARGSNTAVTDDRVYLAIRGDCHVLDPVTGKTLETFSLPAAGLGAGKPKLSTLAVYKDLLIATARPMDIPLDPKPVTPSKGGATSTALADVKGVTLNADHASASATLAVMDRHKGGVLWSRAAKSGFRHNAIAVGADKVFCIDRLSDMKRAYLARRGHTVRQTPTLYALDARTGAVVWQDDEHVFGTWLSYSAEHDILFQSGRHSRDTVRDEPNKGIAAFRGKDGTVLWDAQLEHGGPCMLHHDTVYFNAVSTVGGAVDLLTGKPKTRTHPLTGETIPWQYHRRYGCNSVIASEHLLLFRSGAAGYTDLASGGGTGNLGGFRSGCTSNLIAANGVLNAPDYTRTCTCSYQNQTSLAFVHMPDVEVWTFNELPASDGPIRRLGVNFGAPGDRMADNGTLWLEYPIVGGPSPEIDVALTPTAKSPDKDQAPAFVGQVIRRHTSVIRAGELKWVAGSGLSGVTGVTVRLAKQARDREPHTVRLVFAELEDLKQGQRVFDVSLQGQTVLADFDIVKAGGGAFRAVVKEFKGVRVGRHLAVSFSPKTGRALLCGLEVLAERD